VLQALNSCYLLTLALESFTWFLCHPAQIADIVWATSGSWHCQVSCGPDVTQICFLIWPLVDLGSALYADIQGHAKSKRKLQMRTIVSPTSSAVWDIWLDVKHFVQCLYGQCQRPAVRPPTASQSAMHQRIKVPSVGGGFTGWCSHVALSGCAWSDPMGKGPNNSCSLKKIHWGLPRTCYTVRPWSALPGQGNLALNYPSWGFMKHTSLPDGTLSGAYFLGSQRLSNPSTASRWQFTEERHVLDSLDKGGAELSAGGELDQITRYNAR